MTKIKSFFLFLSFLLAFTASALATDVVISASTIPGFQPANLSGDVTVSPVTVAFNSPTVTCSSCFRQQWVGLSGFRIQIDGVTYTVAFVASKSSLTLTTNYAAGNSSAAVILWHKYVELRIYADSAFQPLGKTYIVQPGAPGSGAWHRRVAASVVNEFGVNNLFIPQLTLDATFDSPTNMAARYYAAFYRPEGAFIQTYDGFESFSLQATGATTWPDILVLNQRQVIVQDTSTYTKAQIDSFRTGCTIGQSLFYASTGLKPSCLNFGAGLTLVGDTLSSVSSVYTTILGNGSPVTQRNFLNFIGPSFTVADNAGIPSTDVGLDADLNALASNSTNGFWARTGAGTGAARTLTGTLNRITVANGDGVAGNPTFDIAPDVAFGPASATDNAIARFDLTTGQLIQNSAVTVADTSGNFSVPNGWSFTNTAGSSLAINGFGFDFTLTSAPSGANGYQAFRLVTGAQTQSSGSTLGLAVVPTYTQSGTAGSEDLVLARVETALGSGQHNFIRGAGGAAGSTLRFRINSLGNYFFGASGGFIGDENGNEYLKFITTANAVNHITMFNSATGVEPAIVADGDDTNITLKLQAKGTGVVLLPSDAAIAKSGPSLTFIDGSNNFNFVFSGTTFRLNNNTGSFEVFNVPVSTSVVNFNAIPDLPASNPTTANQATRKQYVDDTTTAWSVSFFEADPSTVTQAEDRQVYFVPDGTDITVTKLKVIFKAGSHTTGGVLSYTIRRRNAAGAGITDLGAINLDNTNNTINVTYTNDISDVVLTAGDSLSYFLNTVSGTITERSVSIGLVGTQKRIP